MLLLNKLRVVWALVELIVSVRRNKMKKEKAEECGVGWVGG